MKLQYWHILALTLVVGILTAWIIIRLIYLFADRKNWRTLKIIRESITYVLYFFFPALFIHLIAQNAYGTPTEIALTTAISRVGVLIVSTWLVLRVVVIFELLILSRLDLKKVNNNQERKVFTKVKFIKRLVVIAVVTIAFSLFLLSFQRGREIGLGILTSAGIVSVIVGFAAQKTIANLLAGIQIAFTQPIKIEDVVVVEGEWGRIEEINLTYVVVKIWDLRRMILPITYFVDKPFQNWTRNDASVIGSAHFYLDYHTPVDQLRTYLLAELQDSPLWDGQTAALQVTDTREHWMELRAIMSARSSSDAFDLRCIVREKMIRFIQQSYPQALPVVPISHAPSSASTEQ
jgi:small-conductance mechanosensitive channel